MRREYPDQSVVPKTLSELLRAETPDTETPDFTGEKSPWTRLFGTERKKNVF